MSDCNAKVLTLQLKEDVQPRLVVRRLLADMCCQDGLNILDHVLLLNELAQSITNVVDLGLWDCWSGQVVLQILVKYWRAVGGAIVSKASNNHSLQGRDEQVQVVNLGHLLHKVGQRRHETLRCKVIQDVEVKSMLPACEEGGSVITTECQPKPEPNAHARISRRTTASTSGRG